MDRWIDLMNWWIQRYDLHGTHCTDVHVGKGPHPQCCNSLILKASMTLLVFLLQRQSKYICITNANRLEPVSLLIRMSVTVVHSIFNRSSKHSSRFSHHGQNGVRACLEPKHACITQASCCSTKLYMWIHI